MRFDPSFEKSNHNLLGGPWVWDFNQYWKQICAKCFCRRVWEISSITPWTWKSQGIWSKIFYQNFHLLRLESKWGRIFTLKGTNMNSPTIMSSLGGTFSLIKRRSLFLYRLAISHIFAPILGWFWWVLEPASRSQRYWKRGLGEEACPNWPIQRRQVFKKIISCTLFTLDND